MCGIWDWQSTIVKDLNDSQDPKHTLFCGKNAFVAIYALFQTTNVPFLPVQGGVTERGQCHFFYRFFLYQGSPKHQQPNSSIMLKQGFQGNVMSNVNFYQSNCILNHCFLSSLQICVLIATFLGTTAKTNVPNRGHICE